MKRSGELKRSTPLRTKKPMNRGATPMAKPKAAAVAVKNALHGAVRATGKPRQKAMKSKGPRMTPIRRAARGQDCTLRMPGICNADPETTVLCHSNQLADGKGMGLKAPDERACFGCSACHDVLDGRRPRPEWMTYEMLLGAFERAVAETHEILKQKGLMP